jgi:hypothetical protein
MGGFTTEVVIFRGGQSAQPLNPCLWLARHLHWDRQHTNARCDSGPIGQNRDVLRRGWSATDSFKLKGFPKRGSADNTGLGKSAQR